MCAIGIVIMAGALGPSTANATTFEGSCAAVGEGGFANGAGYVSGPNQWWLDATGGCTGVLDGTQIANLPVRVRVRFDDPLTGCAGSLTTGVGTLTFKPGRRSRKRIHFEEAQVGPAAAISGRDGGTAFGYLTAYTQLARQYPDVMDRCLAGTLEKFVAEWAMKTIEPLEG